ncbi:LysM peptidoglycan-binding domain-containing protein [Planomicrobium sp. CPCC 101110]|uniref:C40 family peptidase n=1 Tax=Planomicrobium sp. CPCC 101110 TaxID=2599619 RepID=UPI0011B8323B|nr:peptidoglycan endopeptidase [Planomicrobium sp. CPCC 101110]TWT24840.1 LysM peptidoglycan-binding domain-containing protein [Planomicrobium sp. CPCC 101110]
MKKIAFSVLATGSLALFFGVSDTEASTYTIKSGDSLWKIANENNVSVSSLKQWNNLASDLVYPNQKLTLSAPKAATASTAENKTSATKRTVSSNTYIVKSGDTLSKIALQFKTSVSTLQKANAISGSMIYVGQKLTVNGTATIPAKAATAPAAKTPVASSATTSSTYKVASGDTLSAIAKKTGVSVTQLMNWNNLSSSLIRVGQVLKIEKSASSSKPSTTAVSTPAPSASPTGTYKVASGDTLSAIAHRHGVSVTQIMNWNNLTSSLIRVGQTLKVENSLVATQPSTTPVSAPVTAPTNSSTVNTIISTATSLQGIPYVWGGSTTRGFDCSGYIYYVYNKAGVSVPRTNTTGLDARSYDVSKPQVGDLVFFSNTYRPGISHVGIYIGNNQFIHAGGDRVQITSLNDSYWGKHFDSFKRLYAMD